MFRRCSTGSGLGWKPPWEHISTWCWEMNCRKILNLVVDCMLPCREALKRHVFCRSFRECELSARTGSSWVTRVTCSQLGRQTRSLSEALPEKKRQETDAEIAPQGSTGDFRGTCGTGYRESRYGGIKLLYNYWARILNPGSPGLYQREINAEVSSLFDKERTNWKKDWKG